MTKVNIFEDAKENVMPTWMKFINPGDSVQGTYVGKIVGQKDGYGNEQVIYQIMTDDGKIVNVGFGLNKKFLIQDMDGVKFGQIIGFKFKGTIPVKDKFGKPVNVKDYALHQDPAIVNEVWLKENEGHMPEIVHSTAQADDAAAEAEFKGMGESEGNVPFSTPGNLTDEDKFAVIEKLAKDKLGATNLEESTKLVMEKTNLALIPINLDKIIEALTIL